MNSSSSSKFSNPNPKSRGALCGGSLTCYHGLPAQLRIAKRGSRPGNKFYGFANWPDTNCKFFMWEVDVDKSINQIDKHEQLEFEIGALVDKIQKLKHNKRTMEEVVNSLKVENAKLNGTVKALGIICFCSLGSYVL
ncbi:uncharacterized protein LOC130825981 [Amaranthus tricolor]|uniref:uncharacterized protein LOC130825981 n=1 Tax=Amaranthus tricolor TaxID=29722 RepID=UPI002584DEA5|nr:uncharacterized protein LOC130825981 [Amaranthus tricolor]